MKTALIIAVLSLSGGSLPSSDLPKASKEYLKDVIEICKQYALDEEVKDDKYDKYILDCVNEDLEASGYSKVDKVDLKSNKEQID